MKFKYKGIEGRCAASNRTNVLGIYNSFVILSTYPNFVNSTLQKKYMCILF